MKNNLKWFEFEQNNSFGYFEVNDKVCSRLFIEAESFEKAKLKAEELGCYWDGVLKGIDCPCCGDRWSDYAWEVEIKKMRTKGYEVYVFDNIYSDAASEWNRKYGKHDIVETPVFIEKYGYRKYVGKIKFNNIEEYAQYLSNEFGYTTPDSRIYYENGDVKEIFSDKVMR